MLAEIFFLALEARLRAEEQQSSSERNRQGVCTPPRVLIKEAPEQKSWAISVWPRAAES